jgi:hypothetical protein
LFRVSGIYAVGAASLARVEYTSARAAALPWHYWDVIGFYFWLPIPGLHAALNYRKRPKNLITLSGRSGWELIQPRGTEKMPNEASVPDIPEMDEDVGLFERVTWAKNVLGLGESATLSQITSRSRDLLKKWHPDHCPEDPEGCHRLTKQILLAREILDGYCSQYQFSFEQKEVEKYLSPQEWFMKRFGDEKF